ncbi:intraflagellar transport-associated protein isoform X2 [Trichosurus vulpecula]|uniref:intraflagellar transport-associated protein isoform X2 n=1 Tax=Trichosurus vulpecula TaxID=9337 RepID=UPI00186B4B57|nr:intraflagellar transport-associated protein isoform X2 [Trichosurus vulpecula]
MSAQLLGLGIMDEDRLIEQALDQFINRHEQTYEEFLNTFTHLSKDRHMIKNRTPGTDSSGDGFGPVVYPPAQHIRNEHLSLCPVAQPPEEEQVDNFLDLEDFDMDEETDHRLGRELLLLPGEVEEEVHFSVSGYIPSFDRHSLPESKTCPTEELACWHLKEVPGDEVQPFSLDEEFDYDSVMLTPKFSSAEMKAIVEMSSQSRLEPDMEAGGPNT